MEFGRMALGLIAIILGVSAVLPMGTAYAVTCGTLNADSGANRVILGQATTYVGGVGYISTGDLAVCWKNSSGVWSYLEYSSCDTASSASDSFLLNAGAGDDRVAPAMTQFSCTGAGSTMMNPFADGSIFSFKLTAYMGTGADFAYGTPNGDQLYSNSFTFPATYPADSAVDLLCGYSGNDTLSGDADNTNGTAEERLDGGPGTSDSCNGGDGLATADDAATSCETIYGASYAVVSGCGSSPPDIFF